MAAWFTTPNVTLNTQLNASGSGLGRFVKAVGRLMVSGEHFITQAVAQSDNGYLKLWRQMLLVKSFLFS